MIRRGLLAIALVVASLSLTLLAVEIALRHLPSLWPKGHYGSPTVNPELGLVVHGSTSVYNRVRWTVRRPNSDGFLDIEHRRPKPEGVIRVGVFGDSFVAASQVPLEQTFFRRVPGQISTQEVEVLAFGISGWGTLHSLLAHRHFGPAYDLDVVLYFFYRNDPGDHWSGSSNGRRPKAELSMNGDGYIMQSFLTKPQIPGVTEKLLHDAYDSLLLPRIIRAQIRVFNNTRRQKSGPNEREREWNKNWPPSEWPLEWLETARDLTALILQDFKLDVETAGKRFAVLYVPPGHRGINGSLGPEDLWLPWLVRTCKELGIELLDPTDALRTRYAQDIAVYDDHWSPEGHTVISNEVTRYLAQVLSQESR